MRSYRSCFLVSILSLPAGYLLSIFLMWMKIVDYTKVGILCCVLIGNCIASIMAREIARQKSAAEAKADA